VGDWPTRIPYRNYCIMSVNKRTPDTWVVGCRIAVKKSPPSWSWRIHAKKKFIKYRCILINNDLLTACEFSNSVDGIIDYYILRLLFLLNSI